MVFLLLLLTFYIFSVKLHFFWLLTRKHCKKINFSSHRKIFLLTLFDRIRCICSNRISSILHPEKRLFFRAYNERPNINFYQCLIVYVINPQLWIFIYLDSKMKAKKSRIHAVKPMQFYRIRRFPMRNKSERKKKLKHTTQ